MPDKNDIFSQSFFRAMQLEILVRDLATTALAVVVGGLSIRKMNQFNRIMLLQAFIYMVVDIIGFTMSANYWLYNMYVPVEMALVFLALAVELKMAYLDKILKIFFGVFLIIFLVEMFVVKFQEGFIYLSTLTGYFFAAIVYTYSLYNKFNSANHLKKEWSFVVAAFGLVIYFSGSIPCLAAMSWLMPVDMDLSQSLFQNIVLLLGILRYLFLAVSFVMDSHFKSMNSSDVR